jgi:hypothetical protein
MKRHITAVALAVSALAISAPASAEVIFNPATGMGFVGKGDVQLAYGWNNRQLNTNAAGVTFQVRARATQDYVCSYPDRIRVDGAWVSTTDTAEREETAQVNASISYGARRNAQDSITGFSLTGISDLGSDLVSVGDVCRVGGSVGEVTLVFAKEYENPNLFVRHDGASVQLIY